MEELIRANPPQKKNTLDGSTPLIKHLDVNENVRNPAYLNARTDSNEVDFDQPI